MSIRVTAPSFVSRFSSLAIDAPAKRKAPGTTASRDTPHSGLSSDSSETLARIVISRLVHSRVASTVEAAARSPAGGAVLFHLRSALLRVALNVGGAAPSLTESSVGSLLNLSGSAIAVQRLYDGGLTLPSKLHWPRARALVAALLDSLAATKTTDMGARLESALKEPTPTLGATTQADVMALVQAVEVAMIGRLGGGAASSSMSERTASPPPPPEPPLPVAIAVEIPSATEAGASLSTNVRRLVEARVMHWLSAGDATRLNEALVDALMAFQTSREEAKQLVETTLALP